MFIINIHLLASRVDIAGTNIAQFIHSPLKERLLIVDEISIFSDQSIANNLPSVDMIIYLSRHSAQSMRPSLTVHPIGNFGLAEFGGRDNTIIECHSFLMKKLILNIKDLKMSGEYKLLYNYEISLEVTHHGPYSKSPVVFIEVGSSEDQWNDLEACRLIADAINRMESLHLTKSNGWVSVIGFGGNHYAAKFTQYMLETEFAFGHVCPKYAIPNLTQNLLHQMIKKTKPNPDLVIFDKKGMKRKQQIKAWITDFEIEVKQI